MLLPYIRFQSKIIARLINMETFFFCLTLLLYRYYYEVHICLESKVTQAPLMQIPVCAGLAFFWNLLLLQNRFRSLICFVWKLFARPISMNAYLCIGLKFVLNRKLLQDLCKCVFLVNPCFQILIVQILDIVT